jgi:methylated-DNA-[protein]-cysteine S-methyltransferase
LLVARCARWYGTEEIIPQENRHLTRAQEWLDAYFSRAWDSLPTLTLDQRGSEFELRVWQALQRVPLGQVMSYGELATRINQTGSARAVGGAAGRNPLAIIVPCHRIIGAGGSLTGYAGGLDSKSWLLSHETDL